MISEDDSDNSHNNSSNNSFVLEEESRINEKCIICGYEKCKGKRVALSIIENISRANFIYDKSRNVLDNVYKRSLTLTSAQQFLDQKFRYHQICMRDYEYQKSKKQKMSIDVEIEDLIKRVEKDVKSGTIFSLTDLNKLLSNTGCQDISKKNRKLKSALINYFGTEISFVTHSQKNIGELFYYNDAVGFIIEKSYKHDCLIESANILKKSMKKIDFNINDSFCDKYDLKDSWENVLVPEDFERFLCTLLEIDKKKILNKLDTATKDNNDDTAWASLQLLRLKIIFQILYYIRYKARKKHLSTFSWDCKLGQSRGTKLWLQSSIMEVCLFATMIS